MVDAAQLTRWLGKLRKGTLTEQDLQEALDELKQRGNGVPAPQKLLYLQTHSTAVDSPVNGMSIVEGGEVRLPPDDYEDWPYHTVLDALQDGWRVVKFPELSLLFDHPDEVDRWLGCEFILEK
jgi:hypothetical protein